jgi:hypothetical protein
MRHIRTSVPAQWTNIKRSTPTVPAWLQHSHPSTVDRKRGSQEGTSSAGMRPSRAILTFDGGVLPWLIVALHIAHRAQDRHLLLPSTSNQHGHGSSVHEKRGNQGGPRLAANPVHDSCCKRRVELTHRTNKTHKNIHRIPINYSLQHQTNMGGTHP